jgi:WD40 repeat protein
MRFHHSNTVLSVAFSANGKTLTSIGFDGMRVWDLPSGKQLRHVSGVRAPRGRELDRSIISPDGKFKAEFAGREKLELWIRERTKGEVIHTWPMAVKGGLAFSPDSKVLVLTIGLEMRVHDIPSGKERWRSACEGGPLDIAFSADSKRMAAAAGTRVHVWDVSTGKEVVPIAEHRYAIEFMALSDDGRTVVTEGDGALPPWKVERGADPGRAPLRYWEAATGRKLPSGRAGTGRFPLPVAMSPNGKLLVSRGNGGNLLLWSIAAGKVMHELRHDVAETTCIFSPDSKLLASGGVDRSSREDAEVKLWLWDADTGKGIGGLNWPADGGVRLAFSPDGQLLAACGIADSTVQIWDVRTHAHLGKLQMGRSIVGSLAFSRDSRLLAVAGNGAMEPFRVWEVASGSEVAIPRFSALRERQPGGDDGLVFTPDGRALISSDNKGKVHYWDLVIGRLRKQWKVDTRVSKLALSADGNVLAVECWATILILDLSVLRTKATEETVLVGEKELQDLWSDLANPKAGPAYRAVWRLASTPQQALPFLGKRLRPAEARNGTRIARLVADLDSNSFAVREAAERQLAELGRQAELELRRTMIGKSSAELQKRGKRLLQRWSGLEQSVVPSHELRGLRAIAILEYVGTPNARQILERIAKGAEKESLTKAAKASLRRIAPAHSKTR